MFVMNYNKHKTMAFCNNCSLFMKDQSEFQKEVLHLARIILPTDGAYIRDICNNHIVDPFFSNIAAPLMGGVSECLTYVKVFGSTVSLSLLSLLVLNQTFVKASLTNSLKNQSKSSDAPTLRATDYMTAAFTGSTSGTMTMSIMALSFYSLISVSTDNTTNFWNDFSPVPKWLFVANLMISFATIASYNKDDYEPLIFTEITDQNKVTVGSDFV